MRWRSKCSHHHQHQLNCISIVAWLYHCYIHMYKCSMPLKITWISFIKTSYQTSRWLVETLPGTWETYNMNLFSCNIHFCAWRWINFNNFHLLISSKHTGVVQLRMKSFSQNATHNLQWIMHLQVKFHSCERTWHLTIQHHEAL